ncbi:ATP-binding protein [Flavisericum labens]|uniref:ATP-binding protein n=1 Tax=Flavisericum labens TaxID=3377112 RepID=UPI00387B2120
MNKNQSLKWRFDVNTFRLLGRELITDRITAIYELVKNCYDANATKVVVRFENVNLNDKTNAKIIISDNGHGMSFEDIRDKWMVVGTASKRLKLFSEEPFNRRYVGEKGIGRFAVDKLGDKVKISTTLEGSTERLVVNIDWEEYQKLSDEPQLTLFTEVENGYTFVPALAEEKGTSLMISSIDDNWSEKDLRRLERELEKIVSPFHPLKPPFNIFIESNEFEEYKNKHVVAESVKYASSEFSINYTINSEKQETLYFDKTTNSVRKKSIPIASFGPISLKLFYFNEKAKMKYNRVYKNDDYRIDGIKIYRDGIITTPFAEFEQKRDKKRDVLGIDKRLWSGAWDKVGSREIIGILDISKQLNPKIIDATNRQDFVDNQEYRDLKEYVLDQLKVLGELKISERETFKEKIDVELVRANMDVKEFSNAIDLIAQENPKLKETLVPIKTLAKNIDKSIRLGIIQQEKERDEFVRKENIYLSLMSLQDYAIHISHAIRTSLGKVMRMAEFFKERFPNPSMEEVFIEYASMIHKEMNNLNKVIDFMLSYAGSTIDVTEVSVKDLITNLFNISYIPVFEAEKIKVTIEISDDFSIPTNKKFFEDIFENLISNSIKALRNETQKQIKCSGFVDDDEFVLYYSDNGEGLEEGDEERIFDIYYTTTADLGGAGIGLYIVKTRIESLNGSIEVVGSEFGNQGVTFKMTFPFKKDDDGKP